MCMSILLENLCGVTVKPELSARYAIECGARANGGTDMAALSASIARDYGLQRSTTDSTDELLDALEGGAMAIVNVGGDRKGHDGIFSTGGHYLVAVAADEGAVLLVDPGIYHGKYAGKYRAERVAVLGDAVACMAKALASDCENRSPRYYILGK